MENFATNNASENPIPYAGMENPTPEAETSDSILPTKLADFKTAVFLTDNDLASGLGGSCISHITNVWRVSPQSNFNLASDEPINPGYGLSINPIMTRAKTRAEGASAGYQVEGVMLCFVPTVSTLASTENGAQYIDSCVLSSLVQKSMNSLRAGTMQPKSIADFIESRRKSGEGLTTFNTLAPAVVSAVKEMGWAGVTKDLLRQVLSNSQFASSVMANVDQRVWVSILDKLEDLATTKGLDPQVFVHWKATRDQAASQISEDFGDALAGLDFGG